MSLYTLLDDGILENQWTQMFISGLDTMLKTNVCASKIERLLNVDGPIKFIDLFI